MMVLFLGETVGRIQSGFDKHEFIFLLAGRMHSLFVEPALFIHFKVLIVASFLVKKDNG